MINNSSLALLIADYLDNPDPVVSKGRGDFLRRLFDSLPVGLYRMTPSGEMLNVNPALVEMLGYPDRASLLAVNVEKWYIEPELYWQRQTLLERDGVIRSFEARIRRYDGQLIWVSDTAFFVRAGEGQGLYSAGLMEDVTQRKLAEVELRDSEAQYRTLVETSPDAILLTDLSGQIIFCNQQAAELHGFEDVDTLQGEDVLRLVAPESLPRAVRHARKTLEQGSIRTVEHTLLRRNGSRFLAQLSISLIRDRAGNPKAFLSVVRDITERKQRERELETIGLLAAALRNAVTRAEILPIILEQLLGVMKAAGAAVALVDPATGETVMELAGGVWADWTGRRLPAGEGVSGQVIGTGQLYLNNTAYDDPLFDHANSGAKVRAIACVSLTMQGQGTGAVWIGRHSEIGSTDVRLLTAIAEMTGSALHRAMVLETLEQRVAERTAELAQANEQLKQLDRLKSKLISDVSHELRTPVTNLSLYLSVLERGQPEKQAHYLTILKDETARLANLIEDILSISRLDSGLPQEEFDLVDMNAIAARVVTAHRPRADSAGLILDFEPSPGLSWVRGERQRLTQVATNLVANAINYTPRGGRVVCRVVTNKALDPPQVGLIVSDTGPGIDPEDLPHLFERFYRGQRVSQSNTPGTGLGLAIVKEIVELHKGKLELETEVDRGTTFYVWLPLDEG